MKTNKKAISAIIIYALALVLFIVLTTLIPFEKCASSWVCFGFGIASIIVSCGITFFAFSKGTDFRSKLYGFPVFKVGVVYLAAQMAVCLVMYIIGAFVEVPAWISVLLGIILVGLCLVGVLLTDNARDMIEEVDQKTEVKIKQIKTFTVNIACLKEACQNEECRAMLESLEEDFRFGDPVSSDATQEIENSIKEEIANLTDLLARNDEQCVAKIKQIKAMIASRNAICKLNKV